MHDYEITFDVMNLIKRIIKKWWVILIVSLVFSVAFGGIGAYKGNASYSNGQELLSKFSESDNFANFKLSDVVASGYSEKVMNGDSLDITLLSSVDTAINSYVNCTDIIENDNDMLANGMYYTLNENNVSKNTMVYSITANTTSILPSICTYLNDNILTEDMRNDFIAHFGLNIDQSYLNKMVNVANSGFNFNIYIYGQNMEQVEYLTDLVKAYMPTLISNLKAGYPSNSIVGNFTSNNYYTGTDTLIASNRKILSDEATTALKTRNTIESTLDESSLALYNALLPVITLRETDENAYNALLERDLINKKLIILGFAIGFFLSIVGLIIKYIIQKTLRREEDLIEIFKLPVIGSFKKINDEEEFKKTVKDIELTAKTNNLGSVYLGGDSEKNLNPLREAMRKVLDAQGIKALSVGSDSSENITNLQSMSSAVILTKIDLTKYDDVYKEIEQAKRMNTKVLGFVVLK